MEDEEEEEISDRNLPALTLTKSKFPSQGHGQDQELYGWNEENQLSPWRSVGLLSRGDGSVSDIFGLRPMRKRRAAGRWMHGTLWHRQHQAPAPAGAGFTPHAPRGDPCLEWGSLRPQVSSGEAEGRLREAPGGCGW